MSARVSDGLITPSGEPKLVFPGLAPFYALVRDLSYLSFASPWAGNC